MLSLARDDYLLELDPERGGSIIRFEWCGEPLMRQSFGWSVLDASCFPLVPFSNRIAAGRFVTQLQEVVIPPNCREVDDGNPLHGFGWLSCWQATAAEPTYVSLEHDHQAGDWPWAYRAEQVLRLTDTGLLMTLAVTNLSDTAMPCGLGFHPYFPCNDQTRYYGLHHGEWRNDAAGLPIDLTYREQPTDWWEGRPVSARSVDTVYSGRKGALKVHWPDRELAIVMQPDEALSHTAVYTPMNASFFCVEPVTQPTNGFNQPQPHAHTRYIAPGERFAVSLNVAVV